MAVSNTPVFVQTPRLGTVTISTGTGTANATVLTAGSNGSKVVSLSATSESTTPTSVFIYLSSGGGTPPVLSAVQMAVTAGTDAVTANTDLLSGGPSSLLVGLPTDNDGQKYLFIPSGYSVQVSVGATVPATRRVWFTCVAGDF